MGALRCRCINGLPYKTTLKFIRLDARGNSEPDVPYSGYDQNAPRDPNQLAKFIVDVATGGPAHQALGCCCPFIPQ
jgi:hypothetical protein